MSVSSYGSEYLFPENSDTPDNSFTVNGRAVSEQEYSAAIGERSQEVVDGIHFDSETFISQGSFDTVPALLEELLHRINNPVSAPTPGTTPAAYSRYSINEEPFTWLGKSPEEIAGITGGYSNTTDYQGGIGFRYWDYWFFFDETMENYSEIPSGKATLFISLLYNIIIGIQDYIDTAELDILFGQQGQTFEDDVDEFGRYYLYRYSRLYEYGGTSITIMFDEIVNGSYIPSNAEIWVTLTADRFTSPNPASQYGRDHPSEGNNIADAPDRVREITDPDSAEKVIEEVITSMTPEQRESGDALDDTALFLERAVRRGAQRTISHGSHEIDSDMLAELADTAADIWTNASTTLEDENIDLLRDIRTGATIISDERENLRVEFPDDISDIGLDSITVETDFVSVTLANDAIHIDSEIEVRNLNIDGDSERSGENRRIGLFTFWSVGVIILALGIWFLFTKLDYRFPAWIVPAICGVAVGINAFTFIFGIGFGQRDSFGGLSRERITDTIEVIMSEGMNATVSLPATEAEKDILVLLNQDGVPQPSKYNHVTGTIETKIDESGVYILKEFSVDYNDIEHKSEMMKEAINALASRNIMTGNVEGAFNPDDLITRAEFISAAIRVFDMLDHEAVSSFIDVSRSDWYYTAVATAESENIMGGFADNTFRGNANILKDLLVVTTSNMLVEQMGYLVPFDIEGELAKFSDRDRIEQWSEDGVALAAQSNILIYRTDGQFAPKSTMTRGDAAIILYRVFNKIW